MFEREHYPQQEYYQFLLKKKNILSIKEENISHACDIMLGDK